jgi:hypothetical protein
MNTTLVTADIINLSSTLNTYIGMSPDIFVADDSGQSISELLWVIERDEDGDEALSVTLDCIGSELRLLERNGESFTTNANYWLIGFAHQNALKVVRMNHSFKDQEEDTVVEKLKQTSQLH